MKKIVLVISCVIINISLLAQTELKLQVSQNNVDFLVKSQDGKFLLSGGDENSIKLWEIKTGLLIRDFSHTSELMGLDISPDNKKIAAIFKDSTIVIWNAFTGRTENSIKYNQRIIYKFTVRFIDNHQIFICENNFYRTKGEIINISSGKVMSNFDEAKCFGVNISSKLIISVGSSSIRTYDFSGLLKNTYQNNYGKLSIDKISFNPDNPSQFAFFNGKFVDRITSDFTLFFVDYIKGSIDSVPLGKVREKFLLFLNNKIIYAYYSKKFDFTSRILINEFDPTSRTVKEIGPSEENSECAAAFEKSSFFYGCHFGKGIHLFDIDSSKITKSISSQIFKIKYFLNTGGSIIIPSINAIDSTTYMNNIDIKNGIVYSKKIAKYPVTISNDLKMMVCKDENTSEFQLININDGTILNKFAYKNAISDALISSNGKYLVIDETYLQIKKDDYLLEPTLSVYHTLSGKRVFKASSEDRAFSVSPNSRFLAFEPQQSNSRKKAKIGIVDMESNKTKHITIKANKGRYPSVFIGNLKYIDDSNFVVSYSSMKNNTYILDNNGQIIHQFNYKYSKENDWLRNFYVSPDREILIDVTEYKTYLWNLHDKSLIKTLEFKDPGGEISTTPDNKFLIFCQHSGQLTFYNINSSKEAFSIVFSENGKDYAIITPEGYFDGTEGGIKSTIHVVQGVKPFSLESLFEKYYTPNLLARVMAGEKFDKPGVEISNIKLPPNVRITSPENNSVSSTGQITITVEVTDQGGGIDEIRFFHNGKLVESTNRGFKPVSSNGLRDTKTYTLELLPGENIFKATAFNTQRTESNPDEIVVNYQGTSATADLYLFVIGVNTYKNSKYSLNYALPDAQAFSKEIETKSTGIFANVKKFSLQDSEATKENIISKFS